MEDLSAPAESFAPGWSADWHDKEFLGVDVVIGVGTTVHDVHHWNWEGVSGGTANEAVERFAEGLSSSVGGSEGNGEDGVGAKVGLVIGTIGFDHGKVNGGGVLGI